MVHADPVLARQRRAVLPLALTVVGIQNAQGFAVLRANGFTPPVNTLTALCGLGSLIQGLLGAAPMCVTGPVNAVLNLSGAPERRYVGGIVFGVAILLFGLFAPLMARLALGVPPAFIATLAGLAMLRVLEQTFVAAFAGASPWARSRPSWSRWRISACSISARRSGAWCSAMAYRRCSSAATSRRCATRRREPG